MALERCRARQPPRCRTRTRAVRYSRERFAYARARARTCSRRGQRATARAACASRPGAGHPPR
eukprot:6757014-Prymnesium_polylepis.1